MGSSRIRFMMLGFIIGVILFFLKDLPTGFRMAAPFYGAGIGLLADGIIARIKQHKDGK
ncbi:MULTISPECIES: hypothetical protein [Brevibacillus]|uniref:hypothetical protein n=1 Tax=Brevibacillus TaxID=55080 RepID=UPI001595407F|nr:MULTISPECIES: hypothetical protein [Brevibacillus]MCG7319224.1 hypothetical protein [Brevibacillus laterosporus]MED1788241.1 hypothetical protein [Brevibacillus laterosporus]